MRLDPLVPRAPRLLLRTLLLLLLPWAGVAPAAVAEETPAVQLIVDYGDGVRKHFTRLPWKESMTVHDALRLAAEHKRGIKVETRGSGDTTFLLAIDDLRNEGAGRNWLYQVNGEKGTRSMGIMPLSAGDTVLWEFRPFR